MKAAFRILALGLGLLTAAAGITPAAHAESPSPRIMLAQNRDQTPGIFRFLFRNNNRRQRQAAPPQVQPPLILRPREAEAQPKAKPRKKREAAAPRKRKKRAVAAAPAEKPVEKAADAKRVLVVGDFLAAALAKGLEDAYAQNANAVVIDASSGDSGLVRADHYDWPAKLPELVEEHKPTAVLALIGANDRQEISTDTGVQKIGSDGWRAAYASRVSVLADALIMTGKPVLWAGLAPVRPTAMSRDYSTMNGVIREQLESRGLRFVDTWNGFANEEGKFVAKGPDVRGQPVELRTDDGLNFTRAGQRKLAYFVEQELNEILGSASQLAAADPAAGLHAAPGSPGTVPLISPMVPLDTLVSGGGHMLSSAPAPSPASDAEVAATLSRRLAGEGEAVPPAGRTDNYAWPVLPADAPAAPAPAEVPAAGVPPPIPAAVAGAASVVDAAPMAVPPVTPDPAVVFSAPGEVPVPTAPAPAVQ